MRSRNVPSSARPSIGGNTHFFTCLRMAILALTSPGVPPLRRARSRRSRCRLIASLHIRACFHQMLEGTGAFVGGRKGMDSARSTVASGRLAVDRQPLILDNSVSTPKWRNWQTRGIQNPVPVIGGEGSIPSFGTCERPVRVAQESCSLCVQSGRVYGAR